jgi:hypothetical protein
MSSRKLETSPIEILWEIMKYLDSPSRHSLSHVSKSIRSSLLPFLFKNVGITMRGERDLEKQLEFLSEESIQHIRKILVQGWIPRKKEKLENINITYDSILIDSFDEVESRFVVATKRLWAKLDNRIKSQQTMVKSKENDAWKPLARLISKVPFLTDLIFNSASQLPPCILESLHTHHITCRLHLNTFWLRTLGSGPKPTLHRQELAIIQSPSVYSISTAFRESHKGNKSSYLTESLMDIVTHFVPKLEELHVFDANSTYPSTSPLRDMPKKPWLGLQVDKEYNNQHSRRNLRRLSLGSAYSIYCESIDISKLQSLQVSTGLYGQALLNLANDCSIFNSLQRLCLRIPEKRRYWGLNISGEDFNAAASCFFSKLPALKELGVSGGIGTQIFNDILDKLGPRLRILWIVTMSAATEGGPLFGYGEAVYQRIQEACPQLEYLSLQVGHDMEPARCIAKDGVFEKYSL